MANVFDIAEYILGKLGFVSTMKLQKLAFYSQALSLVKTGEPLFQEQFQAWVNGPVCYELFARHRGKYIVGPDEIGGQHAISLDSQSSDLVDTVLETLGDLSGQSLSELTHREQPWRDARGDCGPRQPCDTVITNEAIRDYYGSRACDNPLFAAK